jgi:hypothetical protein
VVDALGMIFSLCDWWRRRSHQKILAVDERHRIPDHPSLRQIAPWRSKKPEERDISPEVCLAGDEGHPSWLVRRAPGVDLGPSWPKLGSWTSNCSPRPDAMKGTQ